MHEIAIKPVPKPRMTRKDSWAKRPCVMQYWEFKDELILRTKIIGFSLGNAFHVKLYIAMPDSWSGKKKHEMNAMPHDGKGDLDNFVKAIMDSLLKQDKGVYKIIAEKYWAYENKLFIMNIEA